MRWITLPLLCAALWLTGCASTRLVDSDVQSFSQLAGAPARATYSFERLPSQQAQGAQQSAVEEQARLALSWRRPTLASATRACSSTADCWAPWACCDGRRSKA